LTDTPHCAIIRVLEILNTSIKETEMPNRICPECGRTYEDGDDCICEEYSQDVIELIEGGCPNCGGGMNAIQALAYLELERCAGCIEEGDDPDPRQYWHNLGGISWHSWD
jgi:ribosomal protein S27AE